MVDLYFKVIQEIGSSQEALDKIQTQSMSVPTFCDLSKATSQKL
jgi:hypothetical protein